MLVWGVGEGGEGVDASLQTNKMVTTTAARMMTTLKRPQARVRMFAADLLARTSVFYHTCVKTPTDLLQRVCFILMAEMALGEGHPIAVCQPGLHV